MKNKKDNNNLKNNQNLKIKKTIEYTRQIRVKKKIYQHQQFLSKDLEIFLYFSVLFFY